MILYVIVFSCQANRGCEIAVERVKLGHGIVLYCCAWTLCHIEGELNMRLLLHVCCAPDAAAPFEILRDETWEEVTGYFHGSNIHPEDEYRRRADALKFLSERYDINVLPCSYNPDSWFAAASHLAGEPERGKRCAVCFSLQLRAAAEEGVKRGASHLGTTLTISPHKDAALISRLGMEIAGQAGLVWEGRIWRKNNGFLRSVQISKELRLYRQSYCGCIYSKQSTINNES